jgi:hypothetical protein
MKLIFSLLTLLFLQVLSFKEIKPKLCINCKYFITDNDTDKYSKCLRFPREETNFSELITGIHHKDEDNYVYCSIARKFDDLCGKQGIMYKKKYGKKIYKK